MDTAGKAGWAYNSQADYLVYYIPGDGLIYVLALEDAAPGTCHVGPGSIRSARHRMPVSAPQARARAMRPTASWSPWMSSNDTQRR